MVGQLSLSIPARRAEEVETRTRAFGVTVFVRVQHVHSPADLEQVFRFRYRILVDELRRSHSDADHRLRRLRSALDESARVLVAVDDESGAIVGTLRVNFGSDQPFDPALVERLGMGPMIEAIGAARLSYSSAIVVDPAFRGETVASRLLSQAYAEALAARVQVDTITCESSLAVTCHQLGYRPFGDSFSIRGGAATAAPAALVLHHGAYLAKVRSPFARLTYHSPGAGEAVAQKLAALYPRFQDQDVTPQQLDSFWAGMAHANLAAPAPSLFDGIPDRVVAKVLEDLPVASVGTDQELEGPLEGMGLVLAGRLGVAPAGQSRPVFHAVLLPGEVCGSMAGFAASHGSTRIVALEDSRVQLLPRDLPDRMARSDPHLAEHLRKNLAAILVHRLQEANRRVAGFMSGSPQRVAPRPEPQRPASPPAAEPVEAPTAPLSQVLPAESEARWLRRVGLRDGSEVLVLDEGSGEAVLRLARAVPRVRLVGVVPAGALATLRERVAEAGLAERATLLPGSGGRLPLADRALDHAWVRLALSGARDPGAILGEVARVLRPGGVVAALDLDDGGLMLSPEPSGLADFLARVGAAAEALGGSRRVGRRLCRLMSAAGLAHARALVLPMVPGARASSDLLMAAYAPMADLLRQGGSFTAADAELMAELERLAEQPDTWVCVPVICASARVL